MSLGLVFGLREFLLERLLHFFQRRLQMLNLLLLQCKLLLKLFLLRFVLTSSLPHQIIDIPCRLVALLFLFLHFLFK